MYQKGNQQYIILDSFGVDIPFSKTKAEITRLLQEKKALLVTSNEEQIIVKSKVLSLDIVFFVAFQFSGEKMIAITMSPDRYLEGSALYSRYKEVQKALENKFGCPHNPIRSIMNLLDPDSSLARWQNDGIKIEHYLLNRFGMEETVCIKLQF